MSAEKKKMMKFILKSGDGVEVIVEEDAAFQSNLLKKMVMDLGIEEPDSPMLAEALPITCLNGWTLQKVVDWCNSNRGQIFNPKGVYDDPRITLSTDDLKYLDVTNAQLKDLLLAANYLDIPGLFEITTQKFANFADGKSVQQIREIYGLVNDFTREEEEELRKKHEWVEA